MSELGATVSARRARSRSGGRDSRTRERRIRGAYRSLAREVAVRLLPKLRDALAASYAGVSTARSRAGQGISPRSSTGCCSRDLRLGTSPQRSLVVSRLLLASRVRGGNCAASQPQIRLVSSSPSRSSSASRSRICKVHHPYRARGVAQSDRRQVVFVRDSHVPGYSASACLSPSRTRSWTASRWPFSRRSHTRTDPTLRRDTRSAPLRDCGRERTGRVLPARRLGADRCMPRAWFAGRSRTGKAPLKSRSSRSILGRKSDRLPTRYRFDAYEARAF